MLTKISCSSIIELMKFRTNPLIPTNILLSFKILLKGDYDLVNSIKPGTDNQKPGHYVEVGPRGGSVPKGHTATIGKGDRLPPTSTKGNGWKKV